MISASTSLPAAVKIFVHTQPTDMRKSFDGLCGLAEHVMQQDPLSGHLFVFRNRRRDRLKVMYWDSDGLAIWYKRLEQGTFQLPTDLQTSEPPTSGCRPSTDTTNGRSATITLSELQWLLGGVDLGSVKKRKRYARPQTSEE